MADIRITPAASVMAFTSSLSFKETFTQSASGSITLYGSGSTGRTNLFAVDGNNGRLFSIDDDLSNSLFSVNTIAGLPVIEAFADNTVNIGKYGAYSFVATGSGDARIGSGSVMFVSASGNVGIGTTNPGYKFEVIGSSLTTGAIRIAGTEPFYFNSYGGGWYMSDSTWIRGYGGKSLWMDSGLIGGDGGLTIGYGGATPPAGGAIIAGNVGIGTTSPVVITNYKTLTFDATSGTFTEYRQAGTALLRIGVDGSRPFFYGMTNANMDFYTNTIERMRITAAGALLIGTSVTTNTAAGKIVNRLGGTSDPDLVLNGGAWSIASIGGEPALYLSSNIVAATGIPGATQTAKGGMGFEYSSAAVPTDLVLGIFGSPTVASSVRFFNNTERMRITADGNFGFGTTTPSNAAGYTTLTVNGSSGGQITWNTANSVVGAIYNSSTALNIYSSTGVPIRFEAGGNEKMRITDAGNVGIGITNPDSKLHVSTTASNPFRMVRTGGTATNFGFEFGGGDIGLYNYSTSAYGWFLTAAGLVGIGTSAPATKLEVYGGHDDTKARLYSTGNGSTLNASLDMWASEPGLTYDGSGIGNNVNGSPFYGRRNTSLGQSYIRFYQGEIILYTGATTAATALTVATNGNVGIGATSPSTPLGAAMGLVIDGNANTDVQIRLQTNTTGRTSTDGGLLSISGIAMYLWNYENDALYFGTNNTARVTISSAGNVGIGITTPQAPLSFANAVGNKIDFYHSTVSTGDRYGIQVQSDQLIIYSGAAGLSTGGILLGKSTTSTFTEAMRITNAGNVGIGTTTINGKLQVNQGTDLNVAINTVANDATTVSRISSLNDAATLSMPLVINGSRLVLTTDAVERMRITSAGNVGIGTTNPAFNLDVSGSVRTFIGAGSTNYNYFQVAEAGYNLYGRFHYMPSGFSSAGLSLANSVLINAADGATAGLVIRTDANAPIIFGTNQTSERMRITGPGSVGIGTTNPGTNLEVYASNAIVRITNSNAGSYSELHFNEGGALKADLFVVGSSNSAYAGANSFIVYQASNAPIAFYTNGNNERMRITGAGNVGIGTTSTNYTLHVAGGQFGTYLKGGDLGTGSDIVRMVDSSNTTIMLVRGDGNVGIGTTNPGYKLEVNGTTRINGAATFLANATLSTSAADVFLKFANGTNTYGWNLTTANKFRLNDYTNETIIVDIDPATATTSFYYTNLEINSSATTGGSLIFKAGTAANTWAINKNNTTGLSITKNSVQQLGISATGATTLINTLSVTGGYIEVGNYGLTSVGEFATGYIRTNTTSSYGFWDIAGGKGGYTGTLYNTTNLPHIMFATTTGNGGLYYQTASRWILYYDYTNNSLGIGGATTDSSYRLYVNGPMRTTSTAYFGGNTNVIGQLNVSSLTTGTVYSLTGALTNTNPSDIRLKEDITPLEYGLKEILALNPVTYKWKDKNTHGNKKQTGLIAQDVQEIMPNYVRNISEDSDLLGLDSAAINIVLINAIKELKAEIEILKNK